MIESIFDFLSDLLYQNMWLAVGSSFLWGILSVILSPCHLSTIPLIVGYLNSQGAINTKSGFRLSFIFALGILLTIAIIGGITYQLGKIIGDIGSYGNYFVALVFLLVGLFLLDIIKLNWAGIKLKQSKKNSFLAVLVLGLIFGISLGPCTFAFMAPVLGVVFETAKSSPVLSIILLLAFAIGHSLVIVIAGTFIPLVQRYLNWTENSRASVTLRKVCGILVIFGAIYIIFK